MSVRSLVGGPSRRDPEVARHQHQRHGGHQVGDGAAGERGGDGDGEEQAAERWSDELVHGQLDRIQPAVGPAELLVGHEHRHDRLGRGVEQRLADAQGEGDDVEHPELGGVEDDEHGDRADQHGSRSAHERHGPAPVETVGQGAGLQGEQQPRQPAGQRHTGDRAPASG